MILKNMLNMQMMMFLLVLIGFLIRKQNIVETEGRKNMVDLCLYVTLPFNILNSFFVDWKWEMLISCSVILLLSVGYNAVSVFLSSVLFKKAPQDRKKTLRYGTIVSNGGFLGNPIIEGVRDERIVLRFHFYDPGADCDVECWNIGIFKREE